MDKVYSKPINILDFGKLLFNMKLIKCIPKHLRGKDSDDDQSQDN